MFEPDPNMDRINSLVLMHHPVYQGPGPKIWSGPITALNRGVGTNVRVSFTGDEINSQNIPIILESTNQESECPTT